jgi:hypothetical protein
MIVLGLILLLCGVLLGISILTWVGIILLIVGAILVLAGTGGPVGGRWW